MNEVIFIDCPLCDGNGEFYDPELDDEIECPYCEGTGVIEESDSQPKDPTQ